MWQRQCCWESEFEKELRMESLSEFQLASEWEFQFGLGFEKEFRWYLECC